MELQQILGRELTQILHDATHNLARIAEDHVPQTPLKSSKAKVQEIEQETNKSFDKLASDFSTAAKTLFSSLKDLSKTDPEIDIESIIREFDQAKNRLNIHDMKTNAMKLGESLVGNLAPPDTEFVDLSETTAKALYTAASSVLKDKRYDDAQGIFSLLSSVAPKNYNYWIGYGHSAYFNQQYNVSILAYFVATSLSPENHWPLIWAANACEAKKDSAGAFDLLKRAKELIIETSLRDSGLLLEEIENRMSQLQIIK